jgi:hypothetical protein
MFGPAYSEVLAMLSKGSIAAIRTHRWGQDERRLWSALSPIFGEALTVVFHNPKPELDLPAGTVAIDDSWLAAHGLRATPDWGWRCGDYFYYALRQARPDADFYWLLEPDVLFRGDPAAFFQKFADETADGLGAWLGAPRDKHMFLKGVWDRPHMQAIFPVTRLSGRALDWLFSERQAYGRSRIRNHAFTNDEMFVFSWLASNPAFTIKAMEAVAPEWLSGTHFLPNPDILMAAAMDPKRPDGLYHPVRETESYCVETGRRIATTTRFLKMLEPSLGHLTAEDADRIGASVALNLKALLAQGKAGPQ